MRILFATSEMYPLVKTGGLADVSFSLPKALHEEGIDVRVLLPAYGDLWSKLQEQGVEEIKELTAIEGFVLPENGRLLEVELSGGLKVWLVDYPHYFEREGNPYTDSFGEDYADNCQRFAIFSRVAMEIAMGHLSLDWVPDLVHCNDWQTALVPAYLSFHQAPPVVFTIHNMAYQGIFSADKFSELVLPWDWWAPEKLEYHGNLALMKAGIICADRVTTVSPTYSREILTEQCGCGMEGLLTHHGNKVSGIINGIDDSVWNPETDPLIENNFSFEKIHDKTKNKLALQEKLGLPVSKTVPVIGVVSRLVHQKGIDLILEAITALADRQVQWILLGSGEPHLEQQLAQLTEQLGDKVSVTLGYDEPLAHQIEAAADFFLMPSRYEPCGLNQMYSLKYGAVPIVTNTGGLADTVNDLKSVDDEVGDANGIVIQSLDAGALTEAVKKALKVYRKKKIYRQLQSNGMGADFSWIASADQYIELYKETIEEKKSVSAQAASEQVETDFS